MKGMRIKSVVLGIRRTRKGFKELSMITKVEIVLILVLAILIGGVLYSIGSDAAETRRRFRA